MTETIKYFGNIELPVRNWENYGDVNPIEHGGIWIKPDVPTFPGCFYLVKNIPLDDTYGWFVQDGYIDLNDDWIEWDSVFSYAGIDWTAPAEIRAIAAFDYYGPLEFSGESKLVYNDKDLQAELEEWEIEVE
jgi:hypothetical protein